MRTPYQTRFVKRRWEVRLSPVTPREGIRTGSVVLFGHFLRPPYSIRYTEDRLQVNGVLVEPSRVPRVRWRPAPRTPFPPPELDVVCRLLKAMGEAILSDPTMRSSKAERRDLILRIARAEPTVRAARWSTDCALALTLRDRRNRDWEISVGIIPQSPDAEPRSKERRHIGKVEDSLQEELEQGRHLLMAGGTVSCNQDDPRPLVNRIMRAAALPIGGKVRELARVLGPQAAFEIAANYDAREWS